MKVTKKQFNFFIKKTKEFIGVFGLKDWEINFAFGGIPPESISEVFFDGQNRLCIFRLNKTFEDVKRITNDDLSKAAFHEVCELFFAEFRQSMDRSPEITDQIIHKKIRVLENILYDDNIIE